MALPNTRPSSFGRPDGWAARRAHPIVGARTPAETALLAGVEPLDDNTAATVESAAG
jgi:hypothetical protein